MSGLSVNLTNPPLTKLLELTEGVNDTLGLDVNMKIQNLRASLLNLEVQKADFEENLRKITVIRQSFNILFANSGFEASGTDNSDLKNKIGSVENLLDAASTQEKFIKTEIISLNALIGNINQSIATLEITNQS